jgi:PAS domain S-box-containing protein
VNLVDNHDSLPKPSPVPLWSYTEIAIGLSVLAGLYIISSYHYLLFHFLAEIFSIAIAAGLFMIAWNTRRVLDNQYLLFIGIAYLFVGILDTTHTLVYPGMSVIPGLDTNPPTQLWIAARYTESLSLLVAPLFFRKRLQAEWVCFGYALFTLFILSSIFLFQIFPDCYIQGKGLTTFKVVSEFVISGILLGALTVLVIHREEFDAGVFKLLILSIGATIASELSFTVYVNVNELSNLIGHYLKILSFYLIYKAIIQTGLTRPYDLLFRNLRASEGRYRVLFNSMTEGFAIHEILCDEKGDPSDYRFLDVNPAFERLTGLRRADVIGRRVSEVLPDIEPHWIKTYGTVALTGQSIHFESHAAALDKYYELFAYCPAPGQFAVVFMDIGERKRAEEVLQTTLQRFYTVFSGMHSAILLVTDEGRLEYANQAFCDYYGLQDSPADLRHLGSQEVIEKIRHAYLNPDEAVTRIREIVGRGQPVIGEEVAMRGDRTCLRDFIPLYIDGKSYGRLWHHWDITERKRAEEALRRNEARLRLLSETAGRLLATDDPQGLVERLCRDVMEYLNCQAFFNFMVDDHAGRLRLNACAGIPEAEVRKLVWLDYGVAVCGCVARDGARIIAEDIFHTPDVRTELVRSYGIQAYCCHPLKAQERLIGTLSFGTKTRASFTAEEVELMRIVADQVAVAMQRVQVQQDLRQGEEALRQANEQLEQRVWERTAELTLSLADLEKSRDDLRKLASELVLAEERERKRIAVTLHDEVAQTLAAAKMRLDLLKSMQFSAESLPVIEEAGELLVQSIRETLSLMTDISSPVLYDMGLPSAVQNLAEQTAVRHGLPVSYSFSGDLGDLELEVGVMLYQVTRELLQNIVKHSQARSASIRITKEKDTIRAIVSDDGLGFDVDEVGSPGDEGGFGLFSIRERVMSFNGDLRIASTPGKGTEVTVELPAMLRKEKETASVVKTRQKSRKRRKS